MRIVLAVILGFGVIALVVSASEPTSESPSPTIGAASAETTSEPAPALPVAQALPMLDEAPEILRTVHAPLVEVDGWLQSEIDELEDLRGQVVMVEFWTLGCYNCKNRIPYTQELYANYKDQGLEIVGIHSPEFEYEQDVSNIEKALDDLGVTWPIVLDTRRLTFRLWQGSPAYWPRTYVIDQEGQVRFDHIGEGGYDDLEATVAYLLAEGP